MFTVRSQTVYVDSQIVHDDVVQKLPDGSESDRHPWLMTHI